MTNDYFSGSKTKSMMTYRKKIKYTHRSAIILLFSSDDRRLVKMRQTLDAKGHFSNRFNGHDIVVDFNSFDLRLLVTLLNERFP
jgi:hypothetical protein